MLTYGNQKAMDIIAIGPTGQYAIIEVKTKASPSRTRFLTNLSDKKKKTGVTNRFWVFVGMPLCQPRSAPCTPTFYIAADKDVKKIQKKINCAYKKKYREKHGKDFDEKRGVSSIPESDLSKFRDRWDVIEKFLKTGEG